MRPSILFLVFLFHTAGWSTPACEGGAAPQRGSIASATYLRMVRLGVSLGVIKSEDLEAAVKSRKPVDPVANGKSPQSLSIRQKIQAALPNIRTEDWEDLKTEMRGLREKQKIETAQTQAARKETAPIYKWIEHGFVARGFVTKELVASNGEVFVASKKGNSAYIQEIHQPNPPPLNLQNVSESEHDLFETSTGQVLFAALTEDGVHVVDARTGFGIFEYPFAKVNGLNQTDVAGFYDPHLFERDGEVHVALLPKRNTDFSSVKHEVPIVDFDIIKKTAQARPLPRAAGYYFERLEDKHIYAMQMVVCRKNCLAIALIDISTNETKFQGSCQDEDPYMTSIGAVAVYLDEQGQPQTAHYTNRGVFRYDQMMDRAVRVKDAAGSLSPILFRDSDGKMKFLTQSSSKEFEHEMTLTPLDGSSPTKIKVVKQDSNAFFMPRKVLDTPRGKVAVIVETDIPNPFRLSLVELATGAQFTISTTARGVDHSFYSPADRRIFMFSIGPDNPGPDDARLFQLWGAEE